MEDAAAPSAFDALPALIDQSWALDWSGGGCHRRNRPHTYT